MSMILHSIQRCVRDDYFAAFASIYTNKSAYNFTKGYIEGDKGFCGNTDELCENDSDPPLWDETINYTCRETDSNPNNGYTNFDNIGWAMLSAFRLMTQVDCIFIVEVILN